MPSNWLYVESQFPNFNGDETTEEKLEQLQNYLYMLVEQMRYTTQNLDLTNVNQTALNNWESALTRPIYAQIEGEGERITQLAATADGIQATVQGQQEDIQDLQDSVEDQIQVIQEVQVAVGEQGGMITDIQGTVTAQAQQMAQLELTAQGLSATVQEQETKLTEFEGTLTAQGENIGTLEGTIQSQSEKLSDLALTADGLTTTVAEQTQSITNLTGTVEGQGERLEQLGENLSEFTDTVTGSLDGLQAQIDGQIQTWFDREIPTPDNAPANTWESEEDKISHLGDLYYVVDNDTAGGQAYRWAKMDDAYQWVLIEDMEVAKALADAARAQDTADGKRRVFVTQPVPPYDVGDLWAQGDSGDLMRCNTARPMGIYLASDWGKASDYTNDDALHEFVDGTFAQTKEEVTKRISQLEVQADSISATVSSQTTTITKLENTSLTGAVTEYYLSTSKTELVGGSWSETAPEWTEGKYMWSRTRTTRADGGTSYSSPTCIAGAQGEPGINGEDGRGVASSSVQYQLHTSGTTPPTGTWQASPQTMTDEKPYLWTRTTLTYTSGPDSVFYSVSRKGDKGEQGLKGDPGEQGIPGTAGEDGKTPYLHIAYANNSTGTSGFSTTDAAGKLYIGQYVDYEADDSTDPTKYAWTKIKGEKGDQGLQGLQGEKGDQGIQGPKGADGKTSYTHIAYANSADGSTDFSVSDSDREYIGMYVDFTATDSNDPTDYAWSKIKGADGANGTPGKTGADGKTPYLHIAYANSADGSSGFSVSESANKLYIGQYTDFTETDSTDYKKYAWTKIKGETGAQGPQGEPGVKGEDGRGVASSSVHYQLHTSGTTPPTGTWQTSPQTMTEAKPYLWTRTTLTYTSGPDSVFYAVSRKGDKGEQGLKGDPGEQGIPGTAGANGKTPYLHIAYANNSTGTSGFSTTDASGKLYIGQYVDYSANDSTDPTKYAWTKIKGETGATGPQGPQGEKGDSGDSGVGVESVDVQYYLSTSSTTLTGGSWSTTAPTWVNGKYMWSKTVTTLSNGGIEESKPVCITGAKGATGATGATGPQGPQGETGPQGPQGEPGVKGEDGRGVASSAVHYQLHTSGTTPPTGTWQTSPQTMTDAKPYLWTRTTLTYTSGPDSVFYAVSKKGDKGEQGLKGDPGEQGIPGTAGANGKTPYLHIAYANNSTGTSGFSTTDAAGKLYIGQYVDYSANDSTDPTKYAWTKIKGETGATGATGPQGPKGEKGETGAQGPQGEPGVKGEDGRGVASSAVHYQLHTSGTTPPTGTWQTSPQTMTDAKPYLWTRTTLTYTSGPNSVFYTVSKKGDKGEQGLKGDPGEQGIPGTAGANGKTPYLHIAYANNSTGSSGFSTTDASGKLYIGQYVDYSASDSTDPTKYAWTKIKGETGATGATGPKGDKGDTGAAGADGTTITSITEEYYLSTSKTEQVGGSWVTKPPTWSKGMYMWTRSKIVYANPTKTVYTTPLCDSSWEAVNDVEEEVDNQGQIIQTQESRLSDLEINTNAITATVQRVQTETQTSLEGVEQSLQELSEQVSLSLTSDQVNIAIEKKLSEGVETVKTSTGFTFDDEGLKVSKTGSEMSTKVTEDGMEVSQNNDPVLVADSQGVNAKNLNASTYLIISGKARLEAYETDRVACFWIGG